MGTYLARRLLLMIPTLVGITFLVFMLIALSPGGVGEALRASGGGQMEATSRARQQAYLDDRYGLDDPVVVQYLRWLGRISPVKFGTRAQVAPSGERVTAPKAVKEPILRRWFAVSLPAPEPVEFAFAAGVDAEERSRAYRRAANDYAQTRAAYVAANADLEEGLAAYARAHGLRRAVTDDGRVRRRVLASHTPDRSGPEWAAAERLAARAIGAYGAAVQSRERLAAVFAARPFPEAGVAVVPGVLSLAAPDLGVSFTRSRPVSSLIGEALPVTLMINLIAFPIIYLVAIPGGMLAATRKGTALDVGLGVLFIALWSFPVVLAGVLAVGFVANKQYLGWFPVSGLHDSAADGFTFLPSAGGDGGEWNRGFLLDTLWHICLPVMCLVYGGFAILSKQTRAAMLDNFSADYVRTAKAKGVPGKEIVLRHVFRNSLLPLITMFVTIFPATLSGSVVVERIFTIPGMGSLVIEAISLRDREVILATTLMVATVNLLALLLADILYALADPRISFK